MLTMINPATEQVIREIETDNANSIAQKFQRAKEAQKIWRKTPVHERVQKVEQFCQLLLQNVDSLSKTLTQEMGKPIKQARREIKGTTSRLEFFLKNVEKVAATEIHSQPEDKVAEAIEHEPLGVIANISAWNYPYFVGTNVFVPALLCGNAVLYKPSEFAALSGLEMVRLMHEAGIPPDVFVPIIGDGSVGAILVNQPVDGVFFTGSYATGKKIAAQLAGRMIKAQFELGGKDPAYVCDDVDINIAAQSLAEGAFYNTGQSCCSIERIYVHQDVYDAFVDRFVAEVKNYVVGDPMDPATFIGPLTRKIHVGFLTEQVQDAKNKGATVVLGGQKLNQPGHFFAPTVLTEVTHDMGIMRDESFGPVIGIAKVLGDEEATKCMADTEYGLTATVFTKSQDRAKKILSQIEVGTAYVNCCDRVSPKLPWTGRKASGIGSTGSLEGIRTFLKPKAWHLAS